MLPSHWLGFADNHRDSMSYYIRTGPKENERAQTILRSVVRQQRDKQGQEKSPTKETDVPVLEGVSGSYGGIGIELNAEEPSIKPRDTGTQDNEVNEFVLIPPKNKA